MSEADASDPWDEHAEGWEDQPAAHAYASAAFAGLVDATAELELELAGATVCDFGCGTGLLTERMVDRVGTIDAVDTSPAMRAQLERKIAERGWTSVRVASHIPATSATHDLVVCSSVLGFVDDLAATIAELAGLLRAGGVLVNWDWERTSDADDHGLSREDLGSAFAAAGLDVVRIDQAFSIDIEGDSMQPLIGVARVPGSY